MPDSKALLFVHNIDSAVLQSLHDYSSGKGMGAGVEACHLSTLTHSPVGMKKEWKRFLKDLPIPSRLMDKNEFIREFGPRPITFPVVLYKNGPEISFFISTEELLRCRELGDLIALVKERLSMG